MSEYPEEFMPWLKQYSEGVPKNIDLPNMTMYECVEQIAKNRPNKVAHEYMGRKIRYSYFLDGIDLISSCLYAMGLRKGDKILICMPNCPQAIRMMYGANRIGVIATMIHPYSAPKEIEFYINNSDAKVAITLDLFYPNFPYPGDNNCLEKLIVTSVRYGMARPLSMGYYLFEGRDNPKPKYDDKVISWMTFKSYGSLRRLPEKCGTAEDPALILYSGGTTGRSKGILLSNNNLNATSMCTYVASEGNKEGTSMMAVMPIFHGFGLAIGIHLPFILGMKCIIVPRFTPESYAKLVARKHPNFISGVPTLFEHVLKSKHLKNANLKCLEGIFSGGDSLTADLKTRFDKFIAERGCETTIREGYGATECVAAVCITPKSPEKQILGSIGIPNPNTIFKIVKVGTAERADYDEDGEICISGPSVMMEYVKEPEETSNTLKVHDDGLLWLHTGDMGHMNSDGYLFFTQRLKRIIISSGYNVYPSQLEDAVAYHEAVHGACVVGVKDKVRGEIVKMYIELNPGFEPSEELVDSIRELCKKSVAKYAVPRQYEFIDKIPMTKLSKVAYTVLEKRANESAKAYTVPEEGVKILEKLDEI